MARCHMPQMHLWKSANFGPRNGPIFKWTLPSRIEPKSLWHMMYACLLAFGVILGAFLWELSGHVLCHMISLVATFLFNRLWPLHSVSARCLGTCQTAANWFWPYGYIRIHGNVDLTALTALTALTFEGLKLEPSPRPPYSCDPVQCWRTRPKKTLRCLTRRSMDEVEFWFIFQPVLLEKSNS